VPGWNANVLSGGATLVQPAPAAAARADATTIGLNNLMEIPPSHRCAQDPFRTEKFAAALGFYPLFKKWFAAWLERRS
jgi:hypothetical protein